MPLGLLIADQKGIQEKTLQKQLSSLEILASGSMSPTSANSRDTNRHRKCLLDFSYKNEKQSCLGGHQRDTGMSSTRVQQ